MHSHEAITALRLRAEMSSLGPVLTGLIVSWRRQLRECETRLHAIRLDGPNRTSAIGCGLA